ncbi:hypothetical protein FRB91_000169 [Serendipita sp. 411]|nr:hypothetical protein FRC18_011941 [Serendipita sp. 400]KAG8856879.1 hypothetical protein FRB91_000169 [Serendipita sp. 411]
MDSQEFACSCAKVFNSQQKFQLHRSRSIRCKEKWMDEVARYAPTLQGHANPTPEDPDSGTYPTDPIQESTFGSNIPEYDDETYDLDDDRREEQPVVRPGDEILGYEYPESDTEDIEVDGISNGRSSEDSETEEMDEEENESMDTHINNRSTASSNTSRNLSEPLESSASFHMETYPGAGHIFNKVIPRFHTQAASQIQTGKGNLFYPFANEIDFELGLWLHESGLSVSKIDSFLKLQYVTSRTPSFGSGAALRDRIALLPNPASQWKEVTITPRSGDAAGPPTLLYRDPLGVIEDFFSRPSLAPYLEFAPRRVWSNDSKHSRIYSEMATGDWWWTTQEMLPNGATVVPVILGSDKTHLTQFTGDKKAWPLYMSLGNISSKARRGTAMNTWAVIAYIPIITWNDEKEVHGTLTSRLFHQCVEIVLTSLVEAGKNGVDISDSAGNIRKSYPFVASYLADYPEQILVNCAAGKTGPTTIVGPQDLGSAYPAQPRTTDWILNRIRRVAADVDPQSVSAYTAKARKYLLNGVNRPFWERLPLFRADICAAPDLFHGVIRFWRDHIFKWAVNLAGGAEIDARLKVIQPITGFRRFSKGVTHLTQWTGREDWDLQKVFVALIAGAKGVTSKVMRNLRAFHDFMALIQYRSHSDETLQYIEEALSVFHDTKDVYIEKGARKGKKGVMDHFNIPKLAAFPEFVRHIKEMGASPQFSTEIIERNHKSMVKLPFLSSSRYEYGPQMCRYLDRKERIRHTRELLDWTFNEIRMDQERHAVAAWTPRFQRIIRASLFSDTSEATSTRQGGQRNRLVWLNQIPTYSGISLEDISTAYHLPLLQTHIDCYLRDSSDPSGPILSDGITNVASVDVWDTLHIRSSDVQDETELVQSQTLHALPPGAQNGRYPLGHGHFVLVHDSKDAQDVGIEGYRVAQLRLIFRLYLASPPLYSRLEGKNMHKIDLVYVEYLKRSEEPDNDILMYRVQRESSGVKRHGGVIGLDTISRFIQLIPRFGSRITKHVKAETSTEVYKSFYINSFATGQIFQAVY